MSSIRDPYHALRRELLPWARVRELSRLRPARVVRDTALGWAGIAATFAAVAAWPTPLVTLLAVPWIGVAYYRLYTIGHDGLHRRLFEDAGTNDLWNDLFLLGPIGGITRHNNRNHIRHHQLLGTRDDPDRHKHGSFNKTRPSELALFAIGWTSLLPSARNVFLRRENAARRSARYSPRDWVILIGWQALLVGGLTLAIGWWAWPVLWALPVYAFTFLADNFRSFAEHSHPEPDDAADAHRLVTFEGHPLERPLLAPVHMNLHAAHHLWPSIPYYNLPAANREMRAHPAAQQLVWRGSYFAYLARYLRALPLEGAGTPEPAATAGR